MFVLFGFVRVFSFFFVFFLIFQADTSLLLFYLIVEHLILHIFLMIMRIIIIKISKTQIRKPVEQGGSLWSSLCSLGTRVLPRVLPMASSVVSNLLPCLSTAALSFLGSSGMGEILGQGVQTGSFPISQDKVAQMIAYRHPQNKNIISWALFKQEMVLLLNQQGHNKEACWEHCLIQSGYRC